MFHFDNLVIELDVLNAQNSIIITRAICNLQEFSTLWPSIDLIFDNGPITEYNLSKSGSTIVNLSEEGYYSIVRDGWLVR